MTTSITKIGLVQTAPLPGDFSNNLRAIVQGYRECLNHGAELVIAPAAALCGLEPGDLATRRSFVNQTRAALDTLSRELGSAPLLLGAYTNVLGDDEVYVGIMAGEGDEEDPWMASDQRITLVPYLLEHDSVTELNSAEVFSLDDVSIYVDMTDTEHLPDIQADLIVRLPSTPWYAGVFQDDYEKRSWEASMSGCPIACVRPVGTSGGNIYGGGSAVYSAEGTPLMRLPLFENAARVVDLNRSTQALEFPEEAEQLSLALERGIRDSVRNNCFSGVCIPMEHTHSALLATLAIEAIGASNVCGISFDAENKLAEKLGISCFTPQTSQLEEAAKATLGEEEAPALLERLRTSIAITHAESRGLMLCTPLARRELMLGEFRMYGQSGGHLAPLGNLYDIDIFLLSEYHKEKHPDIFGALGTPPNGYTCRIIHEIADLNTPPSALLDDTHYLFKENDVRLVQRKIVASALKRSQLPVILHADPAIEQLHIPISHRLND